jgi:hypothetical protein
MAQLAKLIGDADLTIGRSFERELDNDRLDARRRAVLRFAPRPLLQRQFAAGVVVCARTGLASATKPYAMNGRQPGKPQPMNKTG